MRAAPAIRTFATSWVDRVACRTMQHPLIDTRLSAEGLRPADPSRPPKAVYLGLGLCAQDGLSKAIPLDLLGLLLPAEAVRAAAGAEELIVLVADRHALENGFSPTEVEARAAALERTLERLRERCNLRALTIVRASRMHAERAYRDALAMVRRRAGGRQHEYALRQLADAVYLDERCGGLLKVGWALRGADPSRRRDEVAFDLALREVVGDRVPFVYCRPGRALFDESPRVPPYVALRPEARLCIDRPEDALKKLAAAYDRASPDTVQGFRRHLRALLYTYCQAVAPLPRGTIEERAAALAERIGPATDDEDEVAATADLERDAS